MTQSDTNKLHIKALGVLKRFFGYNSFLPMQWDVISHVMTGHDAVVLMPTGGGKSMCYQIPALLSEGCTLVVSPLLALMKDQVDALMANGIPAASLNSEQSEATNRTVMDQVFAGHIKLLYLSPERLLADIDHWSQDMKISLIAIDEAHCISAWGHDFRPEYTRLSALKQRFPDVPFMALTATADQLTRDDIRKQLHIPDARIFLTSFDRPNISLSVITGVSGQQKVRSIARFIARHPGQSGIIYCLSRKNTESMAAHLQKLGIPARAFHAGLDTATKHQLQRDFINDDLQIICATVAFGMGIDKSNVRWVIHSNMPKNMESYYQEIGRAGRDGAPAEAVMYYSYGDVVQYTNFAMKSKQSQVELDKLRRMQEYAEASVCRRRILLSYFNERYEHDCNNCDVCHNPPERIDGTTLAQMALSAMVRTGETVGMTTLVDILRGSGRAEILQAGYQHLKTYGVGRDLSFSAWNAYLLQMLQLGLIDIAYDDGNHLKVTDYGREILYGRQHIQLTKFVYRARNKKEVKKVFDDSETLTHNDENLFELLRQTRLQLAREAGIAPYMVFSDKTLRVMASEKPTTRLQFATLYGVGEAKTQKYWKPFTDVILRWQSAQQ